MMIAVVTMMSGQLRKRWSLTITTSHNGELVIYVGSSCYGKIDLVEMEIKLAILQIHK